MKLDSIYKCLIEEGLISSVNSNKIKQTIFNNNKLNTLKLIVNDDDQIEIENKLQFISQFNDNIINIATQLQNTVGKFGWMIHSIGILNFDDGNNMDIIKLNSTVDKLKEYLNNNLNNLNNSSLMLLTIYTIKKRNTSLTTDSINIDTKAITKFTKDSKLNINEPLKIKHFKYIYHLTQFSNIEKIKKIGLIPKANKKRYNHPNSIHFSTDPYELYELYTVFKKYHSNEDYYVIKIDTSKLRDNIYCYPDIDMEMKKGNHSAYFTCDNIPPSSFISINKMD